MLLYGALGASSPYLTITKFGGERLLPIDKDQTVQEPLVSTEGSQQHDGHNNGSSRVVDYTGKTGSRPLRSLTPPVGKSNPGRVIRRVGDPEPGRPGERAPETGYHVTAPYPEKGFDRHLPESSTRPDSPKLPPHWTREVHNKMMDLHRKGLTPFEIAYNLVDHYGALGVDTDEDEVAGLLQASSKGKCTPEILASIRSLHGEGKTDRQIVEELNKLHPQQALFSGSWLAGVRKTLNLRANRAESNAKARSRSHPQRNCDATASPTAPREGGTTAMSRPDQLEWPPEMDKRLRELNTIEKYSDGDAAELLSGEFGVHVNRQAVTNRLKHLELAPRSKGDEDTQPLHPRKPRAPRPAPQKKPDVKPTPPTPEPKAPAPAVSAPAAPPEPIVDTSPAVDDGGMTVDAVAASRNPALIATEIIHLFDKLVDVADNDPTVIPHVLHAAGRVASAHDRLDEAVDELMAINTEIIRQRLEADEAPTE